MIRWVEVCYCREYFGIAMHEELPYLEEYLTDIEVTPAARDSVRATRNATTVPALARYDS